MILCSEIPPPSSNDNGVLKGELSGVAQPTPHTCTADDQLLSMEHGEHTAQTIKDAQFKVYANMGHNLPDPIIPQMVNDMLAHLRANPI